MKRKIYEPGREFERATSYWPLYLAWRILDEARDYFRTPIPEAFADKLAYRAEAVFARHPFWARKATPRAGSRKTLQVTQFQSQRQCEFILMFMRHWLAGVLARERPALFRDLPESFKVGEPLPLEPLPKTIHSGIALPVAQDSRRAGSRGRSPHLVVAIYDRRTHRNLKTRRARSDAPCLHFVHGCELLPA